MRLDLVSILLFWQSYRIYEIEILNLQIFIFVNIYQSENNFIILSMIFSFIFVKKKHPAFFHFFENYNYYRN